jgi:glycine/D-amino acid oxidase-like deaminating enzyme
MDLMTPIFNGHAQRSDKRWLGALADAEPTPFWLDSREAPQARPALAGADDCDLAIVGAGFTGLWAALLAKESDPGADVVVLDAGRVAGQASGRNGGICMASLTHGVAQGAELFPDEEARLIALGTENLDAIARTIADHGIACGWERTGELDVASAPWQAEGLLEERDEYARVGLGHEWFDREALQAEIHSPTYQAGLWHHDAAIVDPARLAWGLARVCAAKGVRFYERTPVTALDRAGVGVELRTPWGAVRARRTILATNAFKPLLRRLRLMIVPVYDYVLMTEPLTPAQLDSIGWSRRQALADAGYMFHYYRLTEDQRILWGGWDALYFYGNRIARELEERPAVHAKLAGQFFTTFPQLEGVRFTHRWAGVIDTCSRFCQFWGTALGGSVSYVAGYTGLGVVASRFGAQVALDLVGRAPTELTQLQMVRSRPLPFPPEPLRLPLIEITRRSTEHAELHGGRRNLWLRTLDRFGVGFDS